MTCKQILARMPFTIIFCAFYLSLGQAAELRLRKELVVQQADRALITASGRFDHVKNTVNSLDKDCDLHAPVRVAEIRVAVVGEFMNACSTPIDPAEIKQLTSNSDAQIEGVFRIWFEHPGKTGEVLSEEEQLSPYTSSNPPHAVEIHPIVRVGQRKFHDALRPIEKDGKAFKAKGASQLRALLKRRVTIQEFDGSNGEEYISIESGCCLPNYFRLKAVLESAPKKSDDGHWALVDIANGASLVARSMRVFSIEGTTADNAFRKLKKNAKFSFWTITRMNLSKVQKALEETPGEPIPIPMEFVLLAIEQ